jgi:hypothetical protein
MKSLWNRESWDKVTKEYRVTEKNGESKEIQRNREVMRTGQEKGIGQERRTTMVKLMGLAMPSLNFSFQKCSFY